MARSQMKLAALVLMGLCASAMAGSAKPWSSGTKNSDSINSGFADVFNAVMDINRQAHVHNQADFTAAHARLSAVAAGRSLLSSDDWRPESTKFHDAIDSIRQREQRLEAVGGRQRVLLSSERPESTKFHDAVDSIRQREQRLEAVGGRQRVLLSSERPEPGLKMSSAVESIRQRQRAMEAVAGRGRVLLQGHGHGEHSSVDRMMQNTVKINAAADTVAQAFSRMAMSNKHRLNASENRAAKAAKEAAN